jgi:outer membrane protein OmpA-like peptidoglycan-associated protein
MYEYDEDEEGGRSRGRTIAMVVGVVALALIGWFVVNTRGGGGDDDDAAGGSVIPGDATSTTTAGDGSVAPSASSVVAPATTEDGATSDPTVKADKPATSEATSTTGRPTTAPSTTAAPTTAAPANAPYETLPDGSPQWVVATYDDNSITLDGVVPDQAAKDALEGLAVANAKEGQAETVTNNLTLNPAVPRNVGVRVVELTSTRFPEGSAEVLPPHAAQLDRIVNVMNILPNITALVIGHADQRGDDLENYALSEDRALAVKNYIASRGIAFERLQSRAVGETDLLVLGDDEAALALNRRRRVRRRVDRGC